MEFKLPELGEGVHEGELVKWKVKPGDLVKDDQILCEIMTDKATIEIPSPFHGVCKDIRAKEGETVHVGQVLVTFEGEGKKAGAAASASAPAPAAAPSAAVAPKAPSAPAPAAAMVSSGNLSPESRVLAAPSTRRMAREMGVNLGSVSGSGPHGRVMREDLDQFLRGGTGAVAAAAPQIALRSLPVRATVAGAQTEERVGFKGLRKKISEKMRQSKDNAAHFTYVEEADATALVELRASAKELGAQYGIKVTYLPFVMKAMVAALRKYPILNSHLDESTNEIVLKHYYNIGLSIQTEEGLTAPCVKDVANKSVLQLAKEIQDIVDRARAKKLTSEDFSGSTITLTNAGSIGGLFATPIINFPEVAILGFNKIFRKPVVKTAGGKEEIVIRDWTYFSISLDHRIVDGAVAAEFMKTFIQYIENPSLLILEG
ncbi:MAG: 2-oxo acid dehydrogenase subunit E2 [Bdellovibrionales bacterium]|nr:2-oxo acid dehydrogenase subunit E2 [Bdellovibrionales bacterium]